MGIWDWRGMEVGDIVLVGIMRVRDMGMLYDEVVEDKDCKQAFKGM